MYDGLSVETAPIPEITEKVVEKDDKPDSSKNLTSGYCELCTVHEEAQWAQV